MEQASELLESLGERALDFVEDRFVVGLGSGRAAMAFLDRLASRVRDGLAVRGVATSRATADMAHQLGIELIGLDAVDEIDVTIDGADEVDPELELIKGRGGALVREKIVAAASRQRVILVTSDKLVPVLGSHGVLPVEVVPFGVPFCARRLIECGCRPTLRRMASGEPWVTDNGNCILDCGVAPIADPIELECAITSIPGVVGTGLFLGMADTVLIAHHDRLEVRERP